VPLKAKLAELDGDGRNLRVFAIADPAMLRALEKGEAGEKGETGRIEYGIERDEGLVGDLGLLMRAMALS
jgi:hypothetical protein